MSRPDSNPNKSFYSKDYWDLVFEQLAKRGLFKVSMVILALLYGSAIYAPFLANDRPFVLADHVDYKEYGAAAKGLRSVCSSIVRQTEKGPEGYLETRGEAAPVDLFAALDVEREAMRIRVHSMQKFLDESEHAPLDKLLSDVDAAIAVIRGGETARGLELAKATKTSASALRKEFKAADPDAVVAEGEAPKGKGLHTITTYPLFDAITPVWFFLMAFWALVLSWPFWNTLTNRVLLKGDRERIRGARRKKLLFALGLPAAGAVCWLMAMGDGETAFDLSYYKDRLTKGDIITQTDPVFPWIPMGYAETHTEEKFRSPTWTQKSEIDEAGNYMHGLLAKAAETSAGDFVPPSTPVVVRVGERERNAPTRHLAGTDELGRDFFSRLLWGGRVSLSVGILSAFLLTVIGVVIGSIAGYFGGIVDTAIMRLIEILQSIPAFFLILMVMAMVPAEVMPPIFAIVIVISLIRWTGVARLVRGEFLRLREQEFVLAAKALGFSSPRTIFGHVLPNALSPILVSAAFAVASGILTESAISFLGFGTQAPKASWGSLVNESQSPEHWWIQIFPGLVIFITVTCYNLAGDAVRDALDPKMKD